MTATVNHSSVAALVRFLLARIDEDEAELKRLRRPRVSTRDTVDLGGIRAIDRLRAECAAKRAIIGQAQHLLVLRDLPAEQTVRDAALHLLAALAQPYGAHRAYRADWEPRN